jgi:transposase
MIIPSGAVRVLVATRPVDFRKGMDGLAALVQESLGGNPYSGVVYVFRGRRGQSPTFCIPFSFCDDRLSLASVVRADVAGLAVSAWQGIDLHLHERTA